MDQVTDISSKIGQGGRLYRDARVKAGGDAEATPEPTVLKKAPNVPKPWVVQATEPERPQKVKKPRKERDWQQINSTALEVAGMGVLTAGFSMLYLWLGLVVLGTCLLVLGIATGLPPAPASKARRLAAASALTARQGDQ